MAKTSLSTYTIKAYSTHLKGNDAPVTFKFR